MGYDHNVRKLIVKKTFMRFLIMSKLLAGQPLNMLNLDLNNILSYSYSSNILNNVNYDSINYPSVLQVNWTYNSTNFTSLFGGYNLSYYYNQYNYAVITGGTLTGYLQEYSGVNGLNLSWGIENLNISATEIYNDALTLNTSDDYNTFSKILSGNDTVYGSTFDDILWTGIGNDTIDGGGGTDTVIFSGSRSSYRIGTIGGTTIVSGSNVYDKLTNIANLQFSDGVVDNNASTATDVLVAVNKSGVATYELPDAYSGPVNYLNYQYLGAAGSDIAVGTSKNDFFNLGAGDDAANGSAGDDVLDGGTGSNFLTGGAGWDTFFIDGRGNSTTWGTITDYTLANGSTPNWPDP